MPHDVFISYAMEDKHYADAACASLESDGIRCWIAPRDILPGGIWSEKIINAIQQSRVMVLIFSSHANKSDHIKREVNHAIETGLSVITFRIENVDFTGALEYYLEAVHWLDAVDPPLEKQLRRLNENVKQLLGQAVTAVPDPSPDRFRLPPRSRSTPKWWLGLGAGLLAAVLVLAVWLVMKLNDGPVVVVDHGLPTPTPARSSDTPPATVGNPNTNGNPATLPTHAPTTVNSSSPSPPDDTDSRIGEAAKVLGDPNANVGEQINAIKSLEPLAATSLERHNRVVAILVSHIQNNAKWQGGTNRADTPAPLNIQTAIEVLGRRKPTFGKGETQRLELSDLDLRGVVFRIEGTRANFDGARLRGAHLNNAILMETDFRFAILSNAILSGADVNRTNFCEADLSKVKASKEELGPAWYINEKCGP
jgi:hypothetical protein